MASMYGLDPTTDLSDMCGGTLTFVGIGQHQVQLHLSGELGCSVSIEGHYSVGRSGEPLETFTDAPSGALALASLLGNTVTLAEVVSAGTLRLVFANSAVIELLDSETDFESYQVALGERLIVV